MALKITTREVNGVPVLDLEGRIVLGEETSAVRETVKNLISEGKKKIILNLNNVTFIDSSGLGALVAAHSSAQSGGATLRLSNLGAKFNEMLQITKLYTVFEVSDTEADAVRAMTTTAASAG